MHVNIAEQRMKPSHDQNPRTADEHYQRGVAMMNVGRWDDARESLDKARRAAPKAKKAISRAQRIARQAQGRYMASVRRRSKDARLKVKAIRAQAGVDAAVKAAFKTGK